MVRKRRDWIVADIHTEFRKSNQLAAVLTSFVDPVNGLLDRKLEIEPSRLSVDGGSLVLLDSSNHFV